MAVISIENMSFYAHHGCFEEEQIVGTHFRVDVRFEYDARQAIDTDDVQHTVNYLSVYQTIAEEMKQPSHLLERVADRIQKAIAGRFPQARDIRVRLCKLNPPLGGQVGQVCVEI
ncbi:MAG: dihydroneopterin aldolase [Paludibacteraceae bacterium]|nr:dihydroneopterin aldolase [Paludibacteraceae bacterium]